MTTILSHYESILLTGQIQSKEQAKSIIHSLSVPNKMPCFGYSISAKRCITGSKLVKVKDSVCSGCYALRGWYPKRKAIQNAMEKRYQALFHPLWTEAMSFLIHELKLAYFRWHDSGDIQSLQHLDKICLVAWLCPNTKFWLPTREWQIVEQYINQGNTIPPNLIIRLSAHKINGNGPKTLAKRLGVFISEVREKGYNCPAYTKTYTTHGKIFKGFCGSCRNCWDSSIFNITYKLH